MLTVKLKITMKIADSDEIYFLFSVMFKKNSRFEKKRFTSDILVIYYLLKKLKVRWAASKQNIRHISFCDSG